MELLTVISIIAILVALLMPSLDRARELTRRGVDVSHLHQFSNICQEYASEYRSYLPRGERSFQQDDYVWFYYPTFQILHDKFGLTDALTWCQSLGPQPWIGRPLATRPQDTYIGWIYWGRRSDIPAADGSVAYYSPRTINVMRSPSSQTLVTCFCYDSFSPGPYGWGSRAPHVGSKMVYYPAGTPMDPEPEGLAVGYLDASSRWVQRQDLSTIDQADRLYFDGR